VSTVLGFDYGKYKTGVAVGQTITGTATALETLLSVKNRPNWERISQLIAEWKPDALIVGHPLNVDDTETDATLSALKFSRQLEGRYHIKVHLADERYTSLEARHRLTRKAKREEIYDAIAAKLIIETWLNDSTQ
jgi:putative holliday junction resolvase